MLKRCAPLTVLGTIVLGTIVLGTIIAACLSVTRSKLLRYQRLPVDAVRS